MTLPNPLPFVDLFFSKKFHLKAFPTSIYSFFSYLGFICTDY